ncbi:hypothetical protein L596_005747 [Steinernema carpocapsae]|uniref:Alpha-D-phosphohexomutase alpha/beta/alpha domain-containing protein n=1 Tax=Steinernema carpocapsae TaxID=34508 RepID=A0A4U8V5K2_STECR|nr:hypothetical protein L596_005747 [Steinernema carpocapsae]
MERLDSATTHRCCPSWPSELDIWLLASLRARVKNSRVGVMLTASHNPEDDNGLKIVDPDGEMLEKTWEQYATNLINATDFEFPTVYRAFETQAIRAGVALGDTEFQSFGQLTTPQLHYLVAKSNRTGYLVPEQEYYADFSKAFKELCEVLPDRVTIDARLFLDCAAGIGAPKMGELMAHIFNFGHETGWSTCLGDFVKIERAVSVNSEVIPDGVRAASFDGGADRFMYFYKKGGCCHALDEDRNACFFAKFIGEGEGSAQTAYGNSMKHIKDALGMSVVLMPTGAKHLHRELVLYLSLQPISFCSCTVDSFKIRVIAVRSEHLSLPRRASQFAAVVSQNAAPSISVCRCGISSLPLWYLRMPLAAPSTQSN